ncbi:MAG: hypothetical protein ACLPND_20520 [Candidatus Korobacteraceae bacterium]|jgi:hypothetical protein
MTSRALMTGACCCAAALVAILTAGSLAGCGGKAPISPITPPSTPANITGNWELTAQPTFNAPTPIAVYLTSNAGSVSGIAEGPPAVDNLCTSSGCCGTPIGVFYNVPLTGTVDGGGNLKLGTAAGAIPAFAMTGTASGSNLSNGSFTLSGTCTAQGTITGTEYAPLDGTYAGTVTSQGTGQSFTISAHLDQSSAPNTDGYLGLGGTVDVTGDSCLSSGGGTPISLSGSYLGNNFNTDLTPSSNQTLALTGTLSLDGKTLEINYGVYPGSGSCNDDWGTGTLTLQ